MNATIDDIKQALSILNGAIANSGWAIVHGRRYGYNALDLAKAAEYAKHGGVEKTIRTGMTKAETLRTIWAMLEAVRLVSKAAQ